MVFVIFKDIGQSVLPICILKSPTQLFFVVVDKVDYLCLSFHFEFMYRIMEVFFLVSFRFDLYVCLCT